VYIRKPDQKVKDLPLHFPNKEGVLKVTEGLTVDKNGTRHGFEASRREFESRFSALFIYRCQLLVQRRDRVVFDLDDLLDIPETLLAQQNSPASGRNFQTGGCDLAG
jgi:hypothetical protein